MGQFSFQIASLNVRGLSDRAKRLLVFDFFKKSHFDIIFLQETKTLFNDENDIRNEWHNKKIIINSSKAVKNKSCGGTMVLLNCDNFVVLNSVLTSDGRCIAFDVECNGNRFHMVNTYFPNEDNDIKSFIFSMYPLVSSQYPIIWGGDFNLAPNAKLDRFPTRVSNDTHINDLFLLINTFNLVDICRKMFPNKPLFSFRRGLSKSRIDHFYVSKNLNVESYFHEDFPTSDHDIITIKVLYSSTSISRGKGYWKNKTKIYESEHFWKILTILG